MPLLPQYNSHESISRPLQSVIKETMQQAQAGMRQASRDAMLNRNVVLFRCPVASCCGSTAGSG
ncbi:MAG: hypothetical protein ACYCZH_14125 [Sulfuriferula sp.]